MRIGTKSLLGLSFKQVGLCFFAPLSFGSTPPHSRLCRLNVNSVTQHFPLCSSCFRWDSWVLLWSLMYIYICLRISYGVKRMKYKTFTTASLHWGLETTLGGELARWAGGRRHGHHSLLRVIDHFLTIVKRLDVIAPKASAEGACILAEMGY